MKETILEFSREKVKAMAQQGIIHINSTKHWDVCNAIARGMTMEKVADEMNIPYETVRKIKYCKCPD